MSLTNPNYVVDTTFTAKNISGAASVYAYTAPANYKLIIEPYLDGVAGGGDYVAYITKQLAGAGTAYPILGKTTVTAAAGETAFGLGSISIHVKTGDVVNVMVDGLAGDTSISGKIRIIVDNYSLIELSDIMTDEVPDDYASGTVGAALGKIGSGQITTVSVVAQDGTVTTWQGDDYDADEDRALDWTDSDASWPVLTGATIAVILDETDTYTGSVVTPTGASKQVRLELTAVQTAAITDGSHSFQVVATLQTTSRIVTLVEGVWISKRRFAE